MPGANPTHYQVLARQWRPSEFSAMVWQTHVTAALKNALAAGRVHHAYLFSGTRGVGKTTLARIMAKCLSCEQGISEQPCNQCACCQAINQGQFIDLIEVDAASRTRVEDTRELLENAHYAPTQGRFKIYLIDEIHMLSAHSFNALLKTLEEPPAHVKFLFATTDPGRLPATLLSRCLQFHLKPIPKKNISEHLQYILDAEKIQAEPEALQRIADNAHGSMRDALSLLDQVIDHQTRTVTGVRTRELLGLADPILVLDMLQALADNQPQTALISLQQCHEQNVDSSKVLDQLLEFIHRLAIAQHCPSELDRSPYAEQLGVLSQRFTAEDLQLYYQMLLSARRDLSAAPIIEHAVRMSLIRLFSFAPMPTSQPQPAVLPTHSVRTTPADWPDIVDKLALTGVTATLARHCQCEHWDEHQITLRLDPSHSALLGTAQTQHLETALREHTGCVAKLSISVADTHLETPASLAAQASDTACKAAQSALEGSEHVQSLLRAFDAKIDPQSIESKA